MSQVLDIAVYAEHSDSQKKMEMGWNARVFNRTEMEVGSSIRRDAKTGVISLGPGVYHVTGSSQVTYNDLAQHPRNGGWNTEARPNGGYCRLRHVSPVPVADIPNEDALVVGTISNANMLPSMIDAYVDVPHHAELVLEHQVGDEVDGIYLQDNAVHSTWHVFARIAIHRVRETASTYERSALGSVLRAAYRAFLAEPERYRRLFATYLGVTPKFVPMCDDGAWPSPTDATLARVLASGVLRFGYAENAPYVYHAGEKHDGELMGFEWELGNALTAIIRDQYFHVAPGKGLRAEWVRVTVPAGGDPELARFDALYGGLKDGDFDVAMSGQANVSADQGSPDATREVDWTPPTAILFTNILYSGMGDENLSDLVGASHERFIARVKDWADVKIMCMKNPGPSPTNSAALVDDINLAGGH
ncbi:MAG TPA: hypothetical protein VEX86_23695, partial [Longimicrobium sp.]|nr:hypothetical protein [Longimicrobium sp.]